MDYVKKVHSSEMVPEAKYFLPGYDVPPRFYEMNDGLSLTVPDMTMSIQEMVEKFVRGEAVEGHPVYFDEDEDNIIETGIDLSDVPTEEIIISMEKDVSDLINKDKSSDSTDINSADSKDGATDIKESAGEPTKRATKKGGTTAKGVKRSAPVDSPAPSNESAESDVES